jgi:hypothetical protein
MSSYAASAVAAPRTSARAPSSVRRGASHAAGVGAQRALLAPKRVVARSSRSPLAVSAKAGPSGEVKKASAPAY